MNNKIKWLEVSISTKDENIEIISEVLRDIGSSGISITEPALLAKLALEKGVEEVAFSPPVDDLDPIVKGYFYKENILADLNSKLKRLNLEYKLSFQYIQEEDWANEWKKYYHVTEVGEKLVIKPSWQDYKGERLVLDMDPGMAFGSGTHPSTFMCLMLLEEYLKPSKVVFDVGTGSGILAVAAAKLGASKVLAVDNDPIAIVATKENIVRNKVEKLVEAKEGNLLDLTLEKAELIVANIVADVIIKLAPTAFSLLAPEGIFICSGIYEGREEEVEKFLLEECHFSLLKEYKEKEWTALAVIKKDG